MVQFIEEDMQAASDWHNESPGLLNKAICTVAITGCVLMLSTAFFLSLY
jgi:hypothetical protein